MPRLKSPVSNSPADIVVRSVDKGQSPDVAVYRARERRRGQPPDKAIRDDGRQPNLLWLLQWGTDQKEGLQHLQSDCRHVGKAGWTVSERSPEPLPEEKMKGPKTENPTLGGILSRRCACDSTGQVVLASRSANWLPSNGVRSFRIPVTTLWYTTKSQVDYARIYKVH